MSVLEIRELIQTAIDIELTQKYFLTFLYKNPLKLHSSIKMSAGDQPKKLVSFAMTYAKHSPEVLQQLKRKAIAYDVHHLVDPVIEMVSHLFKSSQQTSEPESQHSLGDRLLLVVSSSYMAHRFAEEVNDWIYTLKGIKLLNSDYTRANLVIHSILGDAYVNQLESMVERLVEQLKNTEKSRETDPLLQSELGLVL